MRQHLILPNALSSLLFGVAVCLWQGGCAVGPDYESPAIEIPEAWTQPMAWNRLAPVTAKQWAQWWTCLDDPFLDTLIERATQENLDLYSARMRIEESRAYRAYVAGSRLPQVEGGASYTRNRYSENGLSGGTGEDMGLYAGGFDASWELDLFGGVRREVESAQASFEAVIDAYYGQQIALQAEVASAYVDLRTVQKRLQYALDNIETQRKTLQLTQNLFEAGKTSEVDVTRAKADLASTEADVPTLRLSETQTLNRLAVLLGGMPGDLGQRLREPGAIPQIGQPWAMGLPADLLRRRPDIRQAERELAAQVAQIGVATAERYPSFSLSGTFELQARQLSDWGNMASRYYSFGPNLRWNLFSGHRITSNIKMQESLAEQARAQYEQTVLTAVEEVENDLSAYVEQQSREQALQRAATAAEKSVQLVQTRYQNGLSPFQDVLDTQRTLVQQQDNLALSQGDVVQAMIGLYKALGGGWSVPAEEFQQ